MKTMTTNGKVNSFLVPWKCLFVKEKKYFPSPRMHGIFAPLILTPTDFVKRFKDEYGQGWHKVKWSGKWEKDSSDDSGAWKKGSDGKWSKGSVSEYKYPDEWKN